MTFLRVSYKPVSIFLCGSFLGILSACLPEDTRNFQPEIPRTEQEALSTYITHPPRVQINAEQTLLQDLVTGLTWYFPKNDLLISHQAAEQYCESLDFAESTEWRLPTAREALSINAMIQDVNTPDLRQTDHPDRLHGLAQALVLRLSGFSFWTQTPIAQQAESRYYTMRTQTGGLERSSVDRGIFVVCVR